MRRGTTPTLTFNLPFSSSQIKYCEIYFAQGDNEEDADVLFTKKYEDCTFGTKTISVKLTQEETLLFEAGDNKAFIQIRFIFNDDSVDATNVIKTKIKNILDDDVIVEGGDE